MFITAAEELFLCCSDKDILGYKGQKREGGIMYGQANRRRRTGEIKLVRQHQFDRIKTGGNPRSRRMSQSRRRRRPRVLYVLGLLLFLFVVGFFSGVRFVMADESTPTSVVITDNVTLAAEPEEPDTGEIVLLDEQGPSVPLVVIDPGHGGVDVGCNKEGVLEKEINLKLALLLADKLKALGIDAVLTREDDQSQPSLEERVKLAEDKGADLFISIHQNSCDDNSVNGVETWYSSANADSRRLAQLVNIGTLDKTGAKERELVVSEDLYVIRESSMPSCLVETGFLSNRDERKALSDSEYQNKIASGIAWGIQYYFYPKTMYLTFDDGPSEENTAAILDILKERGIQATFFVVGENVRKHPEIARRIVEEGHTIGIHCNHHDYDELYASADSFLDDFQEAYDAVYEVTGVKVQFYRFPGGSINAYNKDVYEEIIEKMTEQGFIYFDWNGSLDDAAKNTTPEQLIQNARNSTLGRKKIVMLAHDIVYNTRLCLDDLIDQFPDYQMEPLTADVVPIQF